MGRGFAGLIIFFILLVFAARLSMFSNSSDERSASASNSYIALSRSRFFEANAMDSLLRALASAKGDDPVSLVADASEKFAQWAIAVFSEAKARGFASSIGYHCEITGEYFPIATSQGDVSASMRTMNFSNALKFQGGSVKIVFVGNASAYSDCAALGLMLQFQKDGMAQNITIPSGLHVLSNGSKALDYGLDSD